MPIRTLCARSPQQCWAGGYNGFIAVTHDAGKTWHEMEAYNTIYNRIVFDRFGQGWAAGARGAIVRAEEEGGRWAVYRLAGSVPVNSVRFISDSVGVAVGARGTIVTFKTR